MKIVDTFLFSEPHEKEILLIKLHLESPYTLEWIIVESEYTFQGEFKGLFARQIIDNDERFEPYRSRIHIISGRLKNPPLDYTRSDIDTQGMNSERRQRSLAREYIINKYTDDTWVLLSDSDEIIDFTETANYELLVRHVQASKNGLVFVPRRRFWYDFDNLWNAIRSTPLVTVAQIRAAEGEMALGFLRSDHIGYQQQWERTILFEYSFCYTYNQILRKFSTTPHGGMTQDEIAQSIRCNHMPISKFRKMRLDLHSSLWMEKVTLSPQNSPKYVREHLEQLRTNVVDANYRQNRRTDYPHLYTPQHKMLFWLKQRVKQIRRLF
jgi:Glycosyltransferase family 17